MRTTVAITGALALVMVTGCAREQPSRTVPARPIAAVTTMVDLALTPATSADAFRRWAANDDVARAAGDERLGMAWADDGQVQVTASEFRQAKLAGTAVTRFTYGRPRLYVPRQAGYPRWFVAEVDRNGQDTLMAFTKRAEGSRFRLSMAAAVAKGAKIPAVATGPEGYAFALTPHDQGLLIQPTLVASLQAAIAEEGTKSYSTKVMRPGPYTTGYFESAQKAARKAGKEGLLHDAGFNGTALPVFPLRTQDGGALVLYGLSRAVSTTIKTPGKGHLVLPPEAAHLLAGPLTGTELQVYENLQFAAVVPAKQSKETKETKKPKTPPRASVIAEGGGVVKARTV